MRHIFKCVECEADFDKTDASVLCEFCRNKPPKEVEPVVVAEADENPVVVAVIAKPMKKAKKTAGGE